MFSEILIFDNLSIDFFLNMMIFKILIFIFEIPLNMGC